MATYVQLKEQISQLQRQAEEVRIEEIRNAVNTIKDLMKTHGINIEDLGMKQPKSSKTSTKQVTAKGAALYADGKGNTWSGRGRQPSWIAGKDKAEFLTKK